MVDADDKIRGLMGGRRGSVLVEVEEKEETVNMLASNGKAMS